jgi:nucleotide-binding universal stress UspA family protein
MAYRTMLVALTGDSGLEARLHTAKALASRFDAVLFGMHVTPPPFVPIADGEAVTYVLPELIEVQRKANQEVRERVQAAFRRICGTGPGVVWQEAEGEPDRLLTEAARTADLVLAAKGDPEAMDGSRVAERLAMAAGVPVLMVAPDTSKAFGTSIIAGWNGSREAARALHEALPLLCGAQRVVLCAVGEEAARNLEPAAAMLRRHGAAVQPQSIDEPDGDAGETLLAQAAELGSDLLVMGTYGHTRLRELVFGGATRYVLRAATLPVLFGS